MRSDHLLFRLCDNFAWSICDWTTDKSNDSGSSANWTFADARLEHRDCNTHSLACTSSWSITLSSGPWVYLQVIEDRVEGKFTLTDWNEESLDGRISSFIELIVANLETQLGLYLRSSHFLIPSKNVALWTVCEP